MLSHVAYILIMLCLALSLDVTVFAKASGLLAMIGVIGVWRYSWALTNFVRGLYFVKVAFPRLRAQMERRAEAEPLPVHAYFLITSYKIDPAVTLQVYRALFEAASSTKDGATIVASVVDPSDRRIIKHLFATELNNMSNVRLLFDQIAGTGKRDAIATSLRTIASLNPRASDMLLLVDGDTIVPSDVVAKSAPFFHDKRVGALTTDEIAQTNGGRLFAEWFTLRFAQRQMMMSSMGLGGRVLTLTGRMSVFRANLAINPDFIRIVQDDYIDHWRLGQVKFLTGDDKSTWFWLLKNGYEMHYLPDVQPVALETQPRDGFFDSAVTLMVRWFGNMLRNNARALALPPTKIGFFTWWSILDQRISIWTTLAGPIGVIFAAIFVDVRILAAYAAWVMFTRYLFCAAISVFRAGYFPIFQPFLLYFGQISGAAVKSYVLFRLDRQKWTRQTLPTGSALISGRSLIQYSSLYLHALAVSWLAVAVLILT